MRKPEFITFTGADDHTSIEDMGALSRRYPIEWGILLSPSRQGIDPRYPRGDQMTSFTWGNLRLAAHLCGEHSRRIMEGRKIESPVDLRCFERIQINHERPDWRRIGDFRRDCGQRCIAQSRGDEFPRDTSIDWLHDQSGGCGVKPPIPDDLLVRQFPSRRPSCATP